MNAIITLVKKNEPGEISVELENVESIFHGMRDVFVEHEEGVSPYDIDRLSEIMLGKAVTVNIARTGIYKDVLLENVTNIIYWGSNDNTVWFETNENMAFKMPYDTVSSIEILAF